MHVGWTLRKTGAFQNETNRDKGLLTPIFLVTLIFRIIFVWNQFVAGIGWLERKFWGYCFDVTAVT